METIIERLNKLRCHSVDCIHKLNLDVEDPRGKEYFFFSLAFWETSDLFCLLMENPSSSALTDLFDGGESKGTNLDTRLKFIRDLCSALIGLMNKNKNESSEASRLPVDIIQTPGEEIWVTLIGGYIAKPDNSQEIGQLLDDILEAMLGISQELSIMLDQDEKTNWGEIKRLLTHVVDHFDHTEEMLIESMQHSKD